MKQARKIPIVLDVKYGVVTGARRGVVVVEDENYQSSLIECADLKEADQKAQGKPLLPPGKPVYEVIPDETNLRQFAADHGIDVPKKVPKIALEKIRDAIKKHYNDLDNTEG